MQCTLTMQGFWKGVLPSLVMVSNPSVNYMLYEYLRARLEDWRRVLSAADGTQLRRTSPAGASERRLVRVDVQNFCCAAPLPVFGLLQHAAARLVLASASPTARSHAPLRPV